MTRGSALEPVWSVEVWDRLHVAAARALLDARPTIPPRRAVVPLARRVMRTFTSSFFVVTRFLPRDKRRDVEILYANVRYPDEVVDTLPLATAERERRLEEWAAAYEQALSAPDARAAAANGVPGLAAAFGELVHEHGIPPEHYRSFLSAMRRDIRAQRYETMDQLIAEYVYGSAIVVGFFLTHIFGPARPDLMAQALETARGLGIALQMTNFLRDVSEDWSRGRIYLPLDRLRAAGCQEGAAPSLEALARVTAELAAENDERYAKAAASVGLFSPDTRAAISACIQVYRLLNTRIAHGSDHLEKRASVPLWAKFRVLPVSKYWILPYAYLIER